MTKISLPLLIVASSVFSVDGSKDACETPRHLSGSQNVSLSVQNITREFQLYTPWEGGQCDSGSGWCTGPPSSAKPLVINWHGCSNHVPLIDYAEEISRVVDASKDHGWFAITPVGTRAPGGSFGWNADGIPVGTVALACSSLLKTNLMVIACRLFVVEMKSVRRGGRR